MNEGINKLQFTRELIDDIKIGLEYPCVKKPIKRVGLNRELKFTEGQLEGEYIPVLQSTPGTSREEIRRKWSGIDFYNTQEFFTGALGKKDKSLYGLNNIFLALNKNPTKGSPYVMYSNDGRTYTIRLEKQTDHMDKYFQVNLPQLPKKISLVRDYALFLTDTGLDLIDCQSQIPHRIENKDVIDMTVPEHHDWYFGMLREVPPGKRSILKKNMAYLDRVDLSTSKIETYMIKEGLDQKPYKNICGTWHSQQYICSSLNTMHMIDLREKQSNLFWKIHYICHNTSIKSSSKCGIQEISRGKDNLIFAHTYLVLGSFDIRNLTEPYSINHIPLGAPSKLAVGKHVALYNPYGEFYFQNQKVSSCEYFTAFRLPDNMKFLRFDWYGKNNASDYSLAAFLYEGKLDLFFADGKKMVHTMQKPILTKRVVKRNAFEITSEQLLKNVIKTSSYHFQLGKRTVFPRTWDIPTLDKSHTSEKRDLEIALQNQSTNAIEQLSESCKRVIKDTPLYGTVIPKGSLDINRTQKASENTNTTLSQTQDTTESTSLNKTTEMTSPQNTIESEKKDNPTESTIPEKKDRTEEEDSSD
ncbi:hypothetical protein NEOKW01_0863 [Nematocida sp. AWRm80]|nr:hypothetical protein NEOKW01_0863 [Nematocida sp. AWRm80]